MNAPTWKVRIISSGRDRPVPVTVDQIGNFQAAEEQVAGEIPAGAENIDQQGLVRRPVPHCSFSHNSIQRVKLTSACTLFQAPGVVDLGRPVRRFWSASASGRIFSKYFSAILRWDSRRCSKPARISSSVRPSTSQGTRHPDPAAGIVRQCVHLPLIRHLQAVLQAPQEQVSRPDIPLLLSADEIQLAQALQHFQGIGSTQFGVPGGADHLSICTKNSMSRIPPRPSLRALAAARPHPWPFPLESKRTVPGLRCSWMRMKTKGRQPRQQLPAKVRIAPPRTWRATTSAVPGPRCSPGNSSPSRPRSEQRPALAPGPQFQVHPVQETAAGSLFQHPGECPQALCQRTLQIMGRYARFHHGCCRRISGPRRNCSSVLRAQFPQGKNTHVLAHGFPLIPAEAQGKCPVEDQVGKPAQSIQHDFVRIGPGYVHPGLFSAVART